LAPGFAGRVHVGHADSVPASASSAPIPEARFDDLDLDREEDRVEWRRRLAELGAARLASARARFERLERILNPMLLAEMRSSRTRIGATRGSERLVAPSVRAGRESGCAKSLFVRRPSVAPCRVPCQSTAARRAVGCAVGFRAGESQGLRAGSRSLCRDTSVRGAAGREGHA